MIEVWRIFFGSGWKEQALILLAMLIAGFVEIVGIASLWPAIALIQGDTGAMPNLGAHYVQQAFAWLGLPVSISALLGLILLAASLKFAIATLGSVFVGRCVANFATGLRLALIDAMVRARWSYFIAQPISRFTAALSVESDRAAAAFKAAGLTLATLIQSIGYLVMAVLISWPFFIATAATIAILWLSVGRYMRLAKKAGRSKSQSNRALLHAVIDALTNAKPLKAMNRHTFIGRTFTAHVEKLRQATQAETDSAAAVRAVQDPLLFVVILSGIYAGYTYFALDLASLLGAAILIARIAAIAFQIRVSYQRLLFDRPAFWAIRDILREVGANAETLRGGLPPPERADLVFADVAFAYPNRPVIAGADLSLRAGELTALIGPSGAGKTTIADLIVGLHEPDRGSVRLADHDLREIDMALWRGQLGYIPQENILFNDTILNNLTLGDPAIAREDAIAALKAADAWRFVEALPGGLDFVVGIRGSLLSGGQRQRLSIARALIGKPRLLILDEATSALDLDTARAISQQARALKGERTIIAITHQPLWVEAADSVYEIRSGRVGPAAALAGR